MRATFGIVLAVALICGSAFAASRPANEMPMYGGLPKTPALLAADEELIKANEKAGFTRASGSDAAVQSGWRYFDRKDYATAIKRFNQAWLLDPYNGDAFEGFAVVVQTRDNDIKNAEAFFKQALDKPRHRPVVLSDYGLFLLRQNRIAAAVPVLEQAVTIENQSPDAQALLAMAYAAMKNPAACLAAAKVKDEAFPQFRDDARNLLKEPACRRRP